jgi:fatty acid-binding protein DegV
MVSPLISPSALVELTRYAVGTVVGTVATVATVPVRVMGLLGQAELLASRITVIAENAETLVARLAVLAADADEAIQETKVIVAAAALTVREAEAVAGTAGEVVVQAGAAAAEAAAVAESLAPRVGNVFVVRALDLARAGGRLAPGAGALVEADRVPVLSLVEGAVQVVGTAADLDEATALMAERVRSAGDGLRVAVGIADADAAPVWQALEAALDDAPEVVEVIRYRVGPSVGAHTGPGTAGAFFWPAGRPAGG